MKPENFVLSGLFDGFLTKQAFEIGYEAYFEEMKQNPLKSFTWTSTEIFFEKLKRERKGVCVGPYRNISLFEIGNRIFSDLVVLEGAKQIFALKEYDAKEVAISMSTKAGFDIVVKCNNGKFHLCEAFNVSKSFLSGKLHLTKKGFQDKKKVGKWLEKMQLKEEDLDKRIIIFNEGMSYAKDSNYHFLQVAYRRV